MSGALIGPHIIAGVSPHLAVLRRWQPRVCLVLDPNADDVRALRDVCPNTIIIGRIYRPDSEIAERVIADPVAAGRWAHELALANDAVGAGLVDYVQIANEVCQEWDTLPKLAMFEEERMRLADARGLYRCALFGFSVGKIDLPAHDRLVLWRLAYKSLAYAEVHGHVVAVHQYGAPDLWGPVEKGGADWLLHRLEHQVLPRLPFPRLKFAVTEFGIDGLLLDGLRDAATNELGEGVTRSLAGGPSGWRNYTMAADYVLQLTQVGSYLSQWADRVLGYCVFTLGHYPPWDSYDIAGEVAERLANHYSQVAPPAPPVSTEERMEPEVYDKDGTRRDLAWLTNVYKTRYIPAPGNGDRVFRLAQVHVTSGPATLTVRAQQNDAGLINHAIAKSWPDGAAVLTGADFRTIHKPRATVQWTDGNGFTGFGLGPGDYIGPDGGPDAVWVLHNLYESDVLDLIGWLGGTDHDGPLHLVFDLREVAAPDEPLPEDEPVTTVGMLADKVRWWLEESLRQDEAGNGRRAKTIRYSLVKLDGGLMYRLENALKIGAERG